MESSIFMRGLVLLVIGGLSGWVMAISETSASQEVHIQNLISSQSAIQSRQIDFTARISKSEQQLSGLTASLEALKEGQVRILNKLENR